MMTMIVDEGTQEDIAGERRGRARPQAMEVWDLKFVVLEQR